MAVIGFHFKKMTIDRKKAATGKINVTNNLVLTTVKEAKVNMGSGKQKAVEFTFSFKTKYSPDVATIDLEGAVVHLGTEDKSKEILTKWEKEKKLPKDILEEVYNYILAKCNVQALILAKDMQLPPHIPLPKVSGN